MNEFIYPFEIRIILIDLLKKDDTNFITYRSSNMISIA